MEHKNLQEVEQTLLNNYETYYRLAYSYVRNEADALDVVQESAYKAIRDQEKLTNPAWASTWIYRIVINTAIDFLRKRQKTDLTAEIPETAADPQKSFPNPDGQRLDLERALDRLNTEEKAIVILRYFEDLTLAEIARVMDLNLNTVKARLYRGLKKLRMEMEEPEKQKNQSFRTETGTSARKEQP